MIESAPGTIRMPLRLAAVTMPHRTVMTFLFFLLFVSFLFRLDALTAIFLPVFTRGGGAAPTDSPKVAAMRFGYFGNWPSMLLRLPSSAW